MLADNHTLVLFSSIITAVILLVQLLSVQAGTIDDEITCLKNKHSDYKFSWDTDLYQAACNKTAGIDLRDCGKRGASYRGRKFLTKRGAELDELVEEEMIVLVDSAGDYSYMGGGEFIQRQESSQRKHYGLLSHSCESYIHRKQRKMVQLQRRSMKTAGCDITYNHMCAVVLCLYNR